MHQIAIYKSTVEKDKVAQYILFKNPIQLPLKETDGLIIANGRFV